MKLEHLVQAYKINNVNVELEDMSNENEKAGVIKFCNGIAASYLLDEEQIVVAIKIFCNCITSDKPSIENQINYVLNIINIMQQTMMLLSNIPQKECILILESLGLFNGTFKEEKQIKHLDHIYSIQLIDNLICLSVTEELQGPPVKSQD